MSTEITKEPTFDADAMIAQIDAKLSEKLKEHQTSLDAKLDSFKKEEPEEEDAFTPDDSDDDDAYITKKDLKSVVGSVVKKAQETAKETSRKTLNETLSEQNRMAEQDRKAVTDFPMLTDQTSEFYRAVSKEIDLVSKSYKGAEKDPYLLYNAAARVKSRWVDEGKYASEAMARDEQRRFNNSKDQFKITGRKQDPSKPNERQIAWAEKFGLNKERFTELRGKYSKS